MDKIIFSGVQPSGNLHIGNYIGAISQWVEMQHEYRCFFCVVDQHAITVKQDPLVLRKKIIEIAKIYLASGIDPEKSVIFQQSAVSAHTELGWILNCTSARMSDLNKMTQYKDKARNKEDNTSVGLFDYPVLMAADILLYDTDVVPVGHDQVQHVELCRDLAKRFNNEYGDTFKIPDYKIRKEGARIMALDDPSKKMSKSADSENSYIALTDGPDAVLKKIKKAVTDSGSEIIYDPENKPALANLLTIFSLISKRDINELVAEYQNSGYGTFKMELANAIIDFLAVFQAKYEALDDEKVIKMLEKGAIEANKVAKITLDKVKEKIGFKL